MILPPITVAEFKAQFNREFVYGPGLDTVQDADITRALNEAYIVWNPALWDTDEAKIAYGYSTAHFMVLNIQSAGGLSSVNMGRGVNSHGGGVISAKGVGQVNVTYQVPDFVAQSPILSQFMKTDFGQSFLQLLTPRLVGNVSFVFGQPQNTLDSGGGGNVNPLVINTTSLANATHSVPYSATLHAQGGIVPLVWTIYSGSLPTGLTLTTGGLLAGTPGSGTAGTYFFTVLVTDGLGSTATMNLKLVVG